MVPDPMTDAIVLCIPGPWEDRSALIADMARRHAGRFLPIGQILSDTETKQSCNWGHEAHDPKMQEAFRVSLMSDEPAGFTERIARHKSVLYLSETECGLDVARKMIDLSMACLEAGGIGVKVEIAGKAFSDEKWRALSDISTALYEQMVLHLVATDTGYFSCGMTQLGFPDTVIDTDDFDEAVSTTRAFERYQIYESPKLASGHSFSADASAAKWRMERVDHPYHGDEIFDRALGAWHLVKAA